ncbi:MAG TPA: hypothetical protein VF456_13535 [Vicinamibacterales bacterium]
MNFSAIRLIHIACISLAATFVTADAVAQDEDPVISIGGGLNFYHPTNDNGHPSMGFEVVYPWHGFETRWGPTFCFDSHATDFDHTLGGLNAPLGSLSMQVLVVGYGYKRYFGQVSAEANMSGGYSFNNFSVASDAGSRFATAGVSLVGVDVDNGWVLRPDVSVSYDVLRLVAVGVSAAYLVARPHETITTFAGNQRRRLNADQFELSAEVTVGVGKTKQ